MNVISYTPDLDIEDICRRRAVEADDLTDRVAEIVTAVIAEGDEALRRFTSEFDGVDLSDLRIPVSVPSLPDELERAILVASRNISAFHGAQKEQVSLIETSPGVTCWRKSVPIERVGIYIPGGTAPLFSTVLMLALPARLAGCPEIVLCTPPLEDGSIHPAILIAAAEAGIAIVYPVGGAQAIAAMAYGTETIPKVDKIFGPGNQWVDTAKRLVAADGVAIDIPAGPTEVALLIDESADLSFVAADMIAQAEHGADSDVIVVSVGAIETEALMESVEQQLVDLPRADIARAALNNARIVVCNSAEEALSVVNTYAPEHLIIQTHHAETLAEQVIQAGSVFIGTWTPESLGDYASGTNHTLPTNGSARAYSGVSLDSFVRKITFQKATREGLDSLGPHVQVMAAAEELDGHARAVSVRLDADRSSIARTGFVRRKTNETDITIELNLDGKGRSDCRTGLGFLDHMLDQIARHSGIDLSVRCKGDLEVDEHHSIEDTAIALGTALDQALGDRRGIGRYGFTAPMDDALAHIAIDLSGRSWLVWNVHLIAERVGDVPTEMFSHFFKSLSDAARMNLNIQAAGDNSHHIVEAIFKGFARALGMSVARSGDADAMPSTKGTL